MKQWKKNGQAYQGEPMEIDGKRVYNPTDEMLMRAGYVYVEDVEEELQRAKEVKIAEIAAYSDSEAVNSLTFNGIKTWLTPNVRANYLVSLDAAELLGETNITFVVEGVQASLPIKQVRLLLAKIQRYADACYLVTERHKIAVKALQTVEEVESYDYTTGYPEKLAL
ncbi:MAG: DUF4376 domain-containing protein [Prevotellaceae bacterium]|nr:DUF4376 domain-containing protein [Prevotellaceae bacterium]